MFSLVPVRKSYDYNLPKVFDRFFDDPFFSLFDSNIDSSTWYPVVEISDNENEIIYEFEVPGMEQENLEISLENGILTVSGERTYEKKDEDHVRTERRYGSFTRSFRLPESSDPEAVNANLKDGILRISVAKREETKPRKIDVQVV